ncbi:MAG TPA: GNAT family N-acetyltransferase [Mycobacteriales bacterium]|nr:GNAT family N-acetyltransferase [Mycobacteriales bacterium]
MSRPVVEWTRTELSARLEEVLDVYCEAMRVPVATAGGRRAIITSHLDRSGLRAAAVTGPEGELAGVTYGYRGAAGEWWYDQVRSTLDPEAAQRWLDDAFEVCELHVRPRYQGQGLGRALLDALLAKTASRTAVLSTPAGPTRARSFYRAGGWAELVPLMHFPGDPRPFVVLGRALAPAA